MKNSKIKSIIFLLFLGFAFSSCSKDDDTPPTSPTVGINFPSEPVTAAAEFSVRNRHTSVVFNDKIWVIGGNHSEEQNRYDGKKNDVWYSSDGATWTNATANAPFLGRINHTSVVFDNKLWVIAGDDGVITDDWWYNNKKNDVWYSSDGVTWTEKTDAAQFSARLSPTSVVFDNKIWVIGGYDDDYKNDVWYSSDGETWTKATDNASFSARNRHSSVVFNNKIWVIGGYDEDYKNDVWYSSDGTTWTEATDAAPFMTRESHTSVVFDNKIWVIAGRNGQNANRKNDIWYSSDGINWIEATDASPFTARYNHTSVVFDNKTWIIGGYDGEDKNDVWTFEIDR